MGAARGSLARAYGASSSLRLRLRFVGALVLLVLPLVVAAWAFGSYAAANERSRTDTRLESSLRTAASEYGRILEQAQVVALQLAGSRAVQHALQTRDRGALEQLQHAHPNARFVVGPSRGNAPTGTRRTAEVVVGAHPVGTVVVNVVLDLPTLRKIVTAADLRAQGYVATAVRAGRVAAASAPLSGPLMLQGKSPRTIEVAGKRYRAVSGTVAPGTRLAVLAPNRSVESAADSIRTRILLIGLLVLGAVTLMAYALAPAIGRARVAQNQRVVAERVLAHVADGVMLIDPSGAVRFWNRAAESITGLRADHVLGSHADEVIPGWRDARQRIPVGDTSDLEGGWSSTTVPMEIQDRELWVAVAGVRFDEGTVYSFRDITERERLDQAKTDFVATVSHELRTPLASVYGAALTLQHQFARVQKPQRDRLLELIAQEADRLSSIIDDILLANRLDSGPLEVAHERFDAEHVARTVVTAAQLRAPESISVELTTPPFLPDATGDGDKVGQVLANLVENAVKYSPDGGRVAVVLETIGEKVRFTVHDSGLGIPLDEQERIFQKFYRLDPNLTRGIGGTGLGLYISRELVRRMGGEIKVDSKPGRGSAFSFELPVARIPARVAEPIGST